MRFRNKCFQIVLQSFKWILTDVIISHQLFQINIRVISNLVTIISMIEIWSLSCYQSTNICQFVSRLCLSHIIIPLSLSSVYKGMTYIHIYKHRMYRNHNNSCHRIGVYLFITKDINFPDIRCAHTYNLCT